MEIFDGIMHWVSTDEARTHYAMQGLVPSPKDVAELIDAPSMVLGIQGRELPTIIQRLRVQQTYPVQIASQNVGDVLSYWFGRI